MRRVPTREEKIGDISRIKNFLGVTVLSYPRYRDAGGKFSKWQLYSDGDSWRELCAVCDLEVDRRNAPIPDDTYFARLTAFIQKKGRLPKTSERKLAGLSFRKSRWATLKNFLSEAAEKGIIPPNLCPPSPPDLAEGQDKVLSTKEPSETVDNQAIGDLRRIPPPPLQSLRTNPKWKKIDIFGLPYAPQDENAVIALFAILCHRGIIPWQILDLNSGQGIDCLCHDDSTNTEVRVEFKLVLSQNTWNHSLDDIDAVVCWKNAWQRFPKRVLELEAILRQNDKSLSNKSVHRIADKSGSR
jgi:hypothetical protein